MLCFGLFGQFGGTSLFGYVKIYKNELKVKEYDLFKAYYCGLCKTLKRDYGFASRMGLSYDLTFLSLILSSVYNADEKVEPNVCVANPFKKKPVMISNKYMEYAATANVILTYFKLRDDISDNHSLKSILFYPFVLSAKRKAKKKQPALFSAVKESMKKLSELEKSNCADIDRLANEFASLTKCIFSADIIEDEKTRRIMEHMGYLIGRYIYLLDACDDYENDKKSKSFNILLLKDCPISKEEVLNSLEFTLSEIAGAYTLLDIKKNKPILDNIIYLGLMDSLKKVKEPQDKKRRKHDE